LSNLYADSVSDADKDADATYLSYLDVAGHCTHYDQGKASTDYADSVKDADKDAEDTYLSYLDVAGLGSSFKCNTQSPLGIGCCDGHTKQAPQQRGTWRDISRA